MNADKLPYLYEKETEYFGFFPVIFVDRVINAANETIYVAAERFLTILQSSDENNLISHYQLEEGLQKMLTLLESAVDKNFDLFELFVLKNIFRLPAAITENKLDPPYSSQSQSESQVDALWRAKRQEWKAIKLLNSQLKGQIAKLNSVYEVFSHIDRQLGLLKSQLSHRHHNGPIKETFLSLQSQLATLKTLLTDTLESTKEFFKRNMIAKVPSHPASMLPGMATTLNVEEELAIALKIASIDQIKNARKNFIVAVV